MKQIAFVSGKGGTGKTSLLAAFATLAKSSILIDAHVEGQTLSLLLKPDIYKTIGFTDVPVAYINQARCNHCLTCRSHCQFQAITDDLTVDVMRCRGCSVCFTVCPQHSIELRKRESALIFESNTRFGPMIHTSIHPFLVASDKVIKRMRKQSYHLAKKKQKPIILLDGPPGINEGVYEVIRDTTLVVVVIEPTYAGILDLKRLIVLIQKSKRPCAVIINKSSIDETKTKVIASLCSREKILVLGSIPYHPLFTEALLKEKTIMEHNHGILSEKIKTLWGRLRFFLDDSKNTNQYRAKENTISYSR